MPDHQPERPLDPEPDHSQSHLSETELRVRALESVLSQKGYIEPAALDVLIETYEKKIGPHNGARVVAKAWVDEEFKQRLLAEPTRVIASLGYAGFQGENMVVVENTPNLHNMVVCTLCSCYPWSVLGLPPVWYKIGALSLAGSHGPSRRAARFRRGNSSRHGNSRVGFDRRAAVSRSSNASTRD